MGTACWNNVRVFDLKHVTEPHWNQIRGARTLNWLGVRSLLWEYLNFLNVEKGISTSFSYFDITNILATRLFEFHVLKFLFTYPDTGKRWNNLETKMNLFVNNWQDRYFLLELIPFIHGAWNYYISRIFHCHHGLVYVRWLRKSSTKLLSFLYITFWLNHTKRIVKYSKSKLNLLLLLIKISFSHCLSEDYSIGLPEQSE